MLSGTHFQGRLFKVYTLTPSVPHHIETIN